MKSSASSVAIYRYVYDIKTIFTKSFFPGLSEAPKQFQQQHKASFKASAKCVCRKGNKNCMKLCIPTIIKCYYWLLHYTGVGWLHEEIKNIGYT